MNSSVKFVNSKILEKTADALRKNNMECFVLESKSEVAALVQQLMPVGASAANGGSATLDECGVMQLLRSGSYEFYDREAEGAVGKDIYLKAFSSDFYFSSANAVTINGEIYNMDGNGNRIAALAYGPENVIIIAGINKIVADINAARERNAQIAAPANAHRLNKQTPCTTTGFCCDCASQDRICCSELIMHHQRIPKRIKIILVNEELGF